MFEAVVVVRNLGALIVAAEMEADVEEYPSLESALELVVEVFQIGLFATV